MVPVHVTWLPESWMAVSPAGPAACEQRRQADEGGCHGGAAADRDPTGGDDGDTGQHGRRLRDVDIAGDVVDSWRQVAIADVDAVGVSDVVGEHRVATAGCEVTDRPWVHKTANIEPPTRRHMVEISVRRFAP